MATTLLKEFVKLHPKFAIFLTIQADDNILFLWPYKGNVFVWIISEIDDWRIYLIGGEGSDTVLKVVILEQIEVTQLFGLVLNFIVTKEHAHRIEFAIDFLNCADTWHPVFLVDPML